MNETLLTNTWWFSIPIIGGPLFVAIRDREVVKRMADMKGYIGREKVFTILASILPYPFMLRTIWVPFSQNKIQMGVGICMYLIGIALYFWTLIVLIQTPINSPFEKGPYKISRNPMYSAADIAMAGICVVSGDKILFGVLSIMVVFQHFVILAEERVCKIKYGDYYNNYMAKVPRYILLK